MESKSGYELAAGILQEHPDNPIEAMLEANGGEESEWLEFKASMTLLPEHEANGETTDDLHLNFVKSIVALVNTYGGAFVIGVDDKKHEPVPILLGDMTEETYIRRQVCGKLLKQEWKKLKGKHAGETWKLNHGITHFVTPRFYTFKGERVIVLLIQPCEKGDEVIVKISTDKLDAFNLFYRARGGQGGVAKYSAPEEIESYKNARVHNLLLRGGEPKGNGCSTVETPRSSHFAGRSEELERLRRQLESGKIPVVSGAGGTGKSELVRQYAFRYRDEYPGGMFQIDMECAGSWDEAWRLLVERPANTGVKVVDFLGIPKKNGKPDGGDVRDALLRRARQAGPILLALDNIESCTAFFGDEGENARMFPAGLANGVKIDAVATARVFDISPGVVVPFPLGDLPPEAAVELLLVQHPAETEEERRAAGRVADLLGCRPLFLRRVPAILDAKVSRNAKMVCRSYASLAKALEEDLLGAIGRTGKVDEGHLPEMMWKMTRDSLAGSFLGDAAVRLVRLAAHFSADGFPQHLLRRLWETEVFPGCGDVGLTSEESFGVVLDSCEAHNIFQNKEPVRIHRLDREAILLDPEADKPELAHAIARSLAGYSGASPEVWLSLASFPDIIRQVPDSMVNGSFFATLLSANPALADLCPWEKLNGRDWVDVLFGQSQLEHLCPWEKLSADDWVALLEFHPEFSGKCPWERLSGEDWVGMLGSCPQFADKCFWNKLTAQDWAHLLHGKPQFADQCPWKSLSAGLSGGDWGLLLSAQPRFAAQCPWEKLDGWDWAALLCQQPQFSDKCEWQKVDAALSGKDWSLLLASQPQFADKCPWNELNGDDWAGLLAKRPQFADKCPPIKLNGRNWAGLLARQPGFADSCPWEKLGGHDWATLLSEQPQFADPGFWGNTNWMNLPAWKDQFSDWCKSAGGDAGKLLDRFRMMMLEARRPWKKMEGSDWCALLSEQPQFAEQCKWDKLNGRDWARLLCRQPQFASNCAWEKLDGNDWRVLVGVHPRFAAQCAWEKLDGHDWSELLAGDSQFADKCPWNKLAGKDWSHLLVSQPQVADKCAWEKLDGMAWAWLIGTQPQFAAKCPWEKLESMDWAVLVCDAPRFADKCPWEKLDGGAWVELLLWHSPFAAKCPWEKLEGKDWARFLEELPHFSDQWGWNMFAARCPWEKLEGRDWATLLAEQPLFFEFTWSKLAAKCPWKKLAGRDWAALLAKEPRFADQCDWEKLLDRDWEELLARQPQFEERRPRKKTRRKRKGDEP